MQKEVWGGHMIYAMILVYYLWTHEHQLENSSLNEFLKLKKLLQILKIQ